MNGLLAPTLPARHEDISVCSFLDSSSALSVVFTNGSDALGWFVRHPTACCAYAGVHPHRSLAGTRRRRRLRFDSHEPRLSGFLARPPGSNGPMNHPIAIVIPVKGGPQAKSRLAPVLSDVERLALARSMAAHVIEAARASSRAACVTVVTACPAMAGLARELGALVQHDIRNEGTAVACLQARDALGHDQAILFLNADLPWLRPQTLDQLAQVEAAAVICPDRHRIGTNALLIRPGAALAPAFGGASFARHRAAATQAGVPMVIFDDPRIAFDVDDAADLAARPYSAAPAKRRAA
jgi:2-phospho-L-lactate/phosphoenolpyruvate guanylyltransferase